MRVLQVIDQGKRGGAQQLLLTILPFLREQGVSVEVLILGHGGYLKEGLRRKGIATVSLERQRWNLKVVMEVQNYIQTYRPDIIHAHLFKSVVVSTYAARKTPLIYHDHQGFYPRNWAATDPFLLRWGFFLLYRQLIPRASQIWVLSPGMLKMYKEIYGAENKVRVIPNAIDVKAFSNSASKCKGFFKSTKRHPFVVLGVGRLVRSKNWSLFLRAARKWQDRKEVMFVVVGDGPLKNELLVQQKRWGLRNVLFMGERSDVPCLLKQCDVFLQTSLQETFGIATIEAMAAGCPVVAVYNGGVEFIVDHGVSGLLATNNVNSVLDALNLLYDNPELRLQLSSKAREVVSFAYDSSIVMQHWLDEYQNLLQGFG